MYRDVNFIYNVNYDFTSRYAGQADYFDLENSKDFSPGGGINKAMSLVNVIRNAWTWRLFTPGREAHGITNFTRGFVMSANSMSSHIEQFATGIYERGHRHGAGASIILLSGAGYSLLWRYDLGETPWKDGRSDKVIRVDWKPGTVFVPPEQWYHQHFNSGPDPARFIKLGSLPGNSFYRLTTRQLREGGERIIYYREEDPYVRALYEKELALHGTKIQMPPMSELIETEKARTR